MYGNSNRITRMPDAATPSATRCMKVESIAAPAPCANRNDFDAVFGPSIRNSVIAAPARSTVTTSRRSGRICLQASHQRRDRRLDQRPALREQVAGTGDHQRNETMRGSPEGLSDQADIAIFQFPAFNQRGDLIAKQQEGLNADSL